MLKITVVGSCGPGLWLTFRQPSAEWKSSSTSSEKCCLSVKFIKFGLLKLIGQFSSDLIGCKTQVELVNSD